MHPSSSLILSPNASLGLSSMGQFSMWLQLVGWFIFQEIEGGHMYCARLVYTLWNIWKKRNERICATTCMMHHEVAMLAWEMVLVGAMPPEGFSWSSSVFQFLMGFAMFPKKQYANLYILVSPIFLYKKRQRSCQFPKNIEIVQCTYIGAF